MTLRIATPEDIEAMHAIRLAVRENVLADLRRVTPAHYRAMLERAGRGWVYEANGTIVGFGIADVERRAIWALFVHPDFERRGIGRVLLTAMVEWLFAASTAPIRLTTEEGTRAEHFYRAAGWEPIGRIENGELVLEISSAGRR